MPRGVAGTMRAIRRNRIQPSTAPQAVNVSAYNVSVSTIGQTTATISWDLSTPASGRVEIGTTMALGNLTLNEPGYYSSHSQVIGDNDGYTLSPSTLYYFRVLGTAADGTSYTSPILSFTTAADVASVTYADYDLTGVTSYGGNTIDATGVVDSTAGLNAWIAAQPNGTNATNRARYIFPATATYKITTGLCIGNKSYVTIWGHAATSSAWLPSNSTSYRDPGCTISFGSVVGSNVRSAFLPGHTYTSSGVVGYGKTVTDVVIQGFNINGNASTPGIFNISAETVSAFEVGKAVGLEITLNKAVSIPGDFVRFRGDATVCDNVNVHHNWATTVGRNGASFVEGDTLSFDDNVIDRCGYYGFDVEPDDDTTLAYRVIDRVYVRRNRYGSFGSTSPYNGTFGAIANGTHSHVADIVVTDNLVTGSTYGTYSTSNQDRSLTMYIGQNTSATTIGSDPRIQRVTISRNSVSHSSGKAGPIIRAGAVDTLVVTDNDSNLASGSFLDTSVFSASCSSVTNSGNA